MVNFPYRVQLPQVHLRIQGFQRITAMESLSRGVTGTTCTATIRTAVRT